MKRIVIIFFLTVFYQINVLAKNNQCHIQLPSKIYLINKNQSLDKKHILSSNCNSDILQRFVEEMKHAQGTFKAEHVMRLIDNNNKLSISLSPRVITIKNISSLIKNKLNINNQFKFSKVRFIDGRKSLSLNPFQEVKVICKDCSVVAGDKSYQVIIRNKKTNKNEHLWLTAILLKRELGIIAKNHLGPSLHGVNAESFLQSYIFTKNPSLLFREYKNLSYFKLITTLKKGSPLLRSNLIPIKLLQLYSPAKILLEKNGLSITTRGMPQNNGTLGQSVRLKVNNKILTGIIIGPNKVRVEL